MNSKRRVLLAVNHQIPDRVPINLKNSVKMDESSQSTMNKGIWLFSLLTQWVRDVEKKEKKRKILIIDITRLVRRIITAKRFKHIAPRFSVGKI